MMLTGKRQPTSISRRSCYLKCGAVFLLLSLSILVIACGADNTTKTANPSSPQVTVTITFKNDLSSLGTVTPYLCGAWVTNSTPALSAGSKVPVYARFIHLVNGNPVGVNGARASASVEWANGARDSLGGTTTSDGLVVFYFMIPNRPNMLGKNNLVTVSFSAPNGQSCRVDNQSQPAAFFTFVAASPTPTPTPSVKPTVQSTPVIPSLGITPPTIILPNNGNGKGKSNSTPTPCTDIFNC
jgi:hypothetical protein